ncbi:hypothetical protein [Cesiribacter sp. SM1]|uniref:hypothetical protein n=1 Tax=Cesiribacter sp. SM1 TaxID=2861196 RepID=UPI001CD3E559|nr:hypothetical protein [Cesiribacter sp. SM1]
MHIPFSKLPTTARIWVYAAPRAFTSEELTFINNTAPEFLNSWATHGTPLQAGFQVLEDQFLILAVDEGVQAASGCSIDSSMGYVRMLEKELSLSLTERSLVYFLQDGQVKAYALGELKQLIAEGVITPQTQLVNTLVATKAELEQKWLLPAAESWLKRHFKKAAV